MKLTDYEKQSIHKLGESIHSGKWSNDGLVQLIELSGGYLNLKTIPDYCKVTGLSYNGAKKHRHVKTIFNTKFIIENP